MGGRLWCYQVHLCNRSVFTSYSSVDGEKHVYLSDSRTTLALRKGKVLLKLISWKTLTLSNVLHVPSIKVMTKVSFESGKIVMTKNNVSVGKG